MCEELHNPFQDQVECARYRAERDMLAQAMERVANDIEHTFLGFEGAEDAPAMRWARGLREALGSLHAPARDAAMSARDLLPEEEREAIAWVRKQGGVDAVKARWRELIIFADSVCNKAAPKRRAACGLDGRAMGEALDALEKRLMPEGMEWLVEAWPRFEDDAPLKFGDRGLDVHGRARSVEGVKFTQGGFVFVSDDMGDTWWANDRGPAEDPDIDLGKRVKRPAPKVLGADTHEVAVKWRRGDGGESYEVIGAHTLTHERPEVDSWERLEEDAGKNPFDYCKHVGHRLDTCENSEAYKARDLVRRAKALAGGVGRWGHDE